MSERQSLALVAFPATDPPLHVPPMKDAVLTVIPALNEEESIPLVLDRLRRAGLSRVRVVDNGSTDGTAEAARAGGAEVIREPRRGYGQACWTGSSDLPGDVHWILFCNADGSDDLEAVEELLSLGALGAELVVGCRTKQRRGLTPAQRFGNRLASTLIRLGWGRCSPDLGPLRLVSRSAFERLKLADRGFGWMVEMEIRAVEERLTVATLPVRNHPRLAGRSKISGTLKGGVAAGTVILSTIARMWLTRRKRILPACRDGNPRLSHRARSRSPFSKPQARVTR